MNGLEFDGAAFDDLAWWVEHDRKKALRVISLIREVQRDPHHGTGQPERLKHDLAGCWSRRIDQEHRLVYQVVRERIKSPHSSLSLSLLELLSRMIAVYPGSFDPVTSGHYDIITRAAGMFETLIVLVAANSAKSPLFTAEERVTLLRQSCAGLPNVRVEMLPPTLLVDYVVQNGAKVIVKGLRAVSDFEYEFQMALLNRHLQPGVETIFLMTAAEHSYLSSSIVKEIARLGGDIAGLVPEAVRPALEQKLGKQVGR